MLFARDLLCALPGKPGQLAVDDDGAFAAAVVVVPAVFACLLLPVPRPNFRPFSEKSLFTDHLLPFVIGHLDGGAGLDRDVRAEAVQQRLEVPDALAMNAECRDYLHDTCEPMMKRQST